MIFLILIYVKITIDCYFQLLLPLLLLFWTIKYSYPNHDVSASEESALPSKRFLLHCEGKRPIFPPPSSSSLPRFNLPLSFPSRESKRVKPSFNFHPPLIGERVSSPPFSKFTQRDRIVIWTRNHLHLPEMNANQLYICVYIYMSSR